MRDSVTARSGGIEQAFELDWDTGRWHSASTAPEGDFPFAQLGFAPLQLAIVTAQLGDPTAELAFLL